MSELPIKRSEAFGQLVAALATAQQSFGPLVKTHVNSYTGKKYADLADVIAATQPSLSKNGLSVIQVPIRKDDAQEAGVLTILAHSSGEWISVELILPATMLAKDGRIKFDQQSIGSAITYARRYTWQALVGVAAEEDDDGNAATDQYDPRVDAPKPKTVKAPPTNPAPAKTGGERPQEKSAVPKAVIPQEPVKPPAVQQPATQTSALPFDAVSPDPNAQFHPADNKADVKNPIPEESRVESTTSTTEQADIQPDTSEKPAKSQFDTNISRVRDEIRPALEKAGLKASKGFAVGAKLKNYLLSEFGNKGAKELTDLTTKQWDAFFAAFQATDTASFALKVEEANKK